MVTVGAQGYMRRWGMAINALHCTGSMAHGQIPVTPWHGIGNDGPWGMGNGQLTRRCSRCTDTGHKRARARTHARTHTRTSTSQAHAILMAWHGMAV